VLQACWIVCRKTALFLFFSFAHLYAVFLPVKYTIIKSKLMKQKSLFSFFMFAAVAGLVACDSQSADSKNGSATTSNEEGNSKGIGKYQHVELTHPIDDSMALKGKNIYEVKCASCHKLTDEKLVGPGFANVTERRTPEWIMNFITNTDEMIEKDAVAQQMLEECLVRMPNQNLSEQDARSILEFMRKNDVK
jgi:hypothetical protein